MECSSCCVLQTSSHILESLVSFWMDLKILCSIAMLAFSEFVILCLFSLSAHLLWLFSLFLHLALIFKPYNSSPEQQNIPKVPQLGPVSGIQHYFWDFFSRFLFLLFKWFSGHSLSSAMQTSCSLSHDISLVLVLWHLAKDELAVFLIGLPSLTGNSTEWLPKSRQYTWVRKLLTHPLSHLIPHGSCKQDRCYSSHVVEKEKYGLKELQNRTSKL